MDEPNKAVTPNEPLRAGLIADAEGIAHLAEAVDGAALEIVAQSGKRAGVELPDVEWYDDVRVMAAQAGIEALILATSPRASVELTEMAADQELPVWRLPPLARNFAEATDLATRCRQRESIYRVASWWETVEADVRWALGHGEGVKPAFTHIRVCAAGPSVQSWRASLVDTPGGVLATDAYGMLEALVAVRGLPERVSASVANVRRRPGEAPRETEDVATAIVRYEGGRAAAIHATWDVPPFMACTEHHGAELTVSIDPEGVAVRSREGELLAERRLSASAFMRRELDRFVAAVRQPPEPDAYDPTLERHIAVTALLQAIYLSARTGQPESPLKLYEVQGWPEPR